MTSYKEIEGKYEDYIAKRIERNLKTLALSRYMNTISRRVVQLRSTPIIFTDEDLLSFNLPHSNPLIIKLRIGNAMMSRVLVDRGSSMYIIFWDALQKMVFSENLISPVMTQIHAFNGVEITPIGIVALHVYITDRVLMVTFFIIDTPLAINVIMDREWIHAVKGVVLTLHQVMRYQSQDGMYMIDIKGDLTQNRRCYNVNTSRKVLKSTNEQVKRLEGKSKVKSDLVKEENK